MSFELRFGLPFVSVTICHKDQKLVLEDVVVDTGSAATIFDSDRLQEIGIYAEPDDPIEEVRGIGGVELVFRKKIERIHVEGLTIDSFVIDFGPMDYGFEIDGLIGSDFLKEVGAIIDYDTMEISAKSADG